MTEVMLSLSFFWKLWTNLFSGIPFGDPYVASLAFVLMLGILGKVLKSVLD